jgi:ferredoxin
VALTFNIPYPMATLTDRVPQNIAGKYYVDSTCIDCDQCRATAPDYFGRTDDGMSFLQKQPATAEDIALVEEAMTACATNSIGNDGA